jgi:hypothetical protein
MRPRHVLTGLAALGASSERTIVLAFIDVDYRIRLEPEDIVATLAALNRCSDRSIVRNDGAVPRAKP